LVAGGFLVRWGLSFRMPAISGPIHTTRPLVTLLVACPGPAPIEGQIGVTNQVNVEHAIPDGPTGSLSCDLTTTDGPFPPGSRAFGLELVFAMSHERWIDVTMTLSGLSDDGKNVLMSEVVWNGPAAARGMPPEAAATIGPIGPIRPNSLLDIPGCSRWRLTVLDTVPGKTGTLKFWGLTRRLARFQFAHDREGYRHVLFGDAKMRDPRNAPNIRDYFLEVSRGRFSYTDAGLFGPVALEGWDQLTDPEQVAAAVRSLESQGFDFPNYDGNHDGIVGPDELTVLIIHNNGDGHDGRERMNPGGTRLALSPLRVNPFTVIVPQQFDFLTLSHELTHAIHPARGVDLYGDWATKESLSMGLTLMGATLNTPPDDRKSIYLDPWHRYRLGWFDVSEVRLGDHAVLGSESWRDPRGGHASPLIVRRPGGDGTEYYLFELRDGSGYDNGVGDRGVVAWHVREDRWGGAYRGWFNSPPGHAIYAVGPDNVRGAMHAWKPSDGKFRLQWADGTQLEETFWIESGATDGSSAVLRWSTTEPNQSKRPADRVLTVGPEVAPVYRGPTARAK